MPKKQTIPPSVQKAFMQAFDRELNCPELLHFCALWNATVPGCAAKLIGPIAHKGHYFEVQMVAQFSTKKVWFAPGIVNKPHSVEGIRAALLNCESLTLHDE
jgi:hypothetical protein